MVSESDKPYPEKILFQYGPFIVYCLIAIVLLERLLNLGIFTTIRWQHIVLIGGLLFIPFFRDVDHVMIPNVGGVQMNQTMEWKETMQEVLAETEGIELPPQTEAPEHTPETEDTSNIEDDGESEFDEPPQENQEVQTLGGNVDEIADDIYSLADEHPRLAISQLGMELEHGLRHLISAKGETPRPRYPEMLEQLKNNPEIDDRFIGIAQEIRHARNEAVHSAEFNPENAAGLIDVGIDLLRYINKSTESNKIPEGETDSQQH